MKTCEFDKVDLLAFATGSLNDFDSKRIKSHLESCASCRKYVLEFKAQSTEFLEKNPSTAWLKPESAVAAAKKAPPIFPFRKVYGIAASLAILCTTMYFFNGRESLPLSRVKGSTGLTLVVKNMTGKIERRDTQTYSAGERVQFIYSCERRNKFILMSIDTTGSITQYYPLKGDSSEVLEPGCDIPLSHSILLDEYIGRELFIGVFSERKLSAQDVRDRVLMDFNRTKTFEAITMADKNVTVYTQSILAVK
jgi:hypothetical protein